MKWISKRVPASLDIKSDWDEVREFSEGLAVVRVGEEEGYINTLGEWIISPRFDYASPFRYGFSCIKIYGSWGIINSKGEMIGEGHFDEVTTLKNGYFWVRSKEKVGTLDTKGNLSWLRSFGHIPLGYLSDNYNRLSEDFIQSL